MARNTGDGFRIGTVTDRTQVFNPQTEVWTKRDAEPPLRGLLRWTLSSSLSTIRPVL
jgi:hypothetical protein